MCGGQVLIVMVGGRAFNISPLGQTPAMWAYAIVLGFLSIPFGCVLRLIPDSFVAGLVRTSSSAGAHSKVPGVTVSDEERFDFYPEPFADVRDELAFLKRVKGGRLNNLKFAMKHPKEYIKARSPSHSRENSRTNSISINRASQTPTREDSMNSHSGVPTPDSRRRSRSMRSRSNSALGAATVMSGIVAGSIAAGWSPIDRRGEADFGQFPPRYAHGQGSQSDSQPSQQTTQHDAVLGEQHLTEEPPRDCGWIWQPARSDPEPSEPQAPLLHRAEARFVDEATREGPEQPDTL